MPSFPPALPQSQRPFLNSSNSRIFTVYKCISHYATRYLPETEIWHLVACVWSCIMLWLCPERLPVTIGDRGARAELLAVQTPRRNHVRTATTGLVSAVGALQLSLPCTLRTSNASFCDAWSSCSMYIYNVNVLSILMPQVHD